MVVFTKMWHRNMKWANAAGKNGADKRVQQRLPQAFNLFFKKNGISKKCDVAKYNKMSYAYSFYYNVNVWK